MRKTTLIAAAAAAVACLGGAAPAGAATTCTATAIWHHDWDGDATLTPIASTATGDGCDQLLPPAGTRYVTRSIFELTSPARAGLWRIVAPRAGGTIKVTGHDLDAALVGHHYTAVFDGDGSSCGFECYRTTGRWVGID